MTVPVRPVVLLVALLLAGCGGLEPRRPADLPDQITGDQVGRMAERQLESEHADLAPGTMTCPDLALEVGEEVRCERVADLPGGRRVRVLGTVAVTAIENGGRLHVQLDEDIVEFGVTGQHLVADLRARLVARGRSARGLTCPYLEGRVAQEVRCAVRVGARRVSLRVVVTGIDRSTSSTSYRVIWPRTLAPKQSLAFIAEPAPLVVPSTRDD